MDTERLRYFLTISRLGSLAEAAKVLNVSSPALSKAMRVLENEVGVQLFLRTGRKLTLSDQGNRLLPQIEDVMGKLTFLRGGGRSQLREKSRVRIATFEIFSTHFLGPMLAAFPADTEVELHEALPGVIERLIADSQADVGLTYLPIPWTGIEFLEITKIEMGVFGKKNLFDGVELAQMPFAVPVNPLNGIPSRAQGLDGWPEDRLPRWHKYRVSMMESALELCRRGEAVAYLPKFIVRLHNRTVTTSNHLDEVLRTQFKDSRQPVYLVKRKSDRESRFARDIASVVRKSCRK